VNPVTGTVWADVNDRSTFSGDGQRPRLVPPVQVLRFDRAKQDAVYHLEIDDVNLERFGRFLLFLFLPCALLLFWRIDASTVSAAFCAFLVSFRFMRLTGSRPDNVAPRMFAIFWIATIFLVVGSAIAGSYLSDNNHSDPIEKIIAFVFSLPYLAGFVFFLRGEDLLDFVAPKLPAMPVGAKLPEMGTIAVAQFGFGEVHVWEAFRCLRDARDIESLQKPLGQYWASKNVEAMASQLKTAEKRIQAGGELGVNAFNTAQAWIDVAREKLSDLMAMARYDLARFNIDYDSFEIPYETELHLDYVKSLQKHLESEMLAKRSRQITFGAAGGIYQLHLLHANLLLTAAVGAGAMIAKRLYRGSALRQLAEVQGQLRTKLEVVAGDLRLLDEIFVTRIIPQYEHIVRVCTNLERYRAELAQHLDASEADRRDHAMRLAFTVAEAKYYLSMTAGN
jgi:hypothetical protein